MKRKLKCKRNIKIKSTINDLDISVLPPLNKKVETITKKALIFSNVKKLYAQASKANILPNINDVMEHFGH